MKKIIFEPQVYTFDIDFAHHVSNIVYIKWMEIGRLKLLEAIGLSVHTIADKGFTPVLTYTEISYKKPIFLGDSVRIEHWVSDIQSISATLEFRFYKNGDVLAASGTQKGLFVKTDNMKPYRLKPEDRAAFKPYIEFN